MTLSEIGSCAICRGKKRFPREQKQVENDPTGRYMTTHVLHCLRDWHPSRDSSVIGIGRVHQDAEILVKELPN